MNTRTRVFNSGIVFSALFFWLTSNLYTFAYAEDPTHLQVQTKLMGKPLVVQQNADPSVSQQGVQTSTLVQFLGINTQLMNAALELQSTTLGTTNWYIDGKQIWSGNLALQSGSLVYSGGIAPIQIPFPLFAYPLGPITLEVDAGIDFQGNLAVHLTPGLSIPVQDSSLQGTMQESLTAGGYLEGYAKLLIARAGVGGKVNLIDGSVGVNADIFFNQSPPTLGGLGKVVFLNGNVYAFVDTIKLFGQWNRVLSSNLYSWAGKCYAFGAATCTP